MTEEERKEIEQLIRDVISGEGYAYDNDGDVPPTQQLQDADVFPIVRSGTQYLKTTISVLKQVFGAAPTSAEYDAENQVIKFKNGSTVLFSLSVSALVENVTISQSDYDNLSQEQKMNGKYYFIPEEEEGDDSSE